MKPDPAIEKDVISKASLNADFMNSFLSLLCIEVDQSLLDMMKMGVDVLDAAKE